MQTENREMQTGNRERRVNIERQQSTHAGCDQVWIMDVMLNEISSHLAGTAYGETGAAYVLTKTAEGVDYLVGASQGGVRCYLFIVLKNTSSLSSWSLLLSVLPSVLLCFFLLLPLLLFSILLCALVTCPVLSPFSARVCVAARRTINRLLLATAPVRWSGIRTTIFRALTAQICQGLGTRSETSSTVNSPTTDHAAVSLSCCLQKNLSIYNVRFLTSFHAAVSLCCCSLCAPSSLTSLCSCWLDFELTFYLTTIDS